MNFFAVLARGIPVTLEMTALSFVVGAVIGVPLVILRRNRFTVVRAAIAFVIEFVRGVPAIVWLFVVYFGIAQQFISFSTMQAAVITLGGTSAAYMAEIYRSGLLAVPRGQWDASAALGLNRIDTLSRLIGPQAIRVALPSTAAYVLALLKNSSVAYTIGVTDILYWANRTTEETLRGVLIFSIAGLFYLVLGAPLAILTRWLEGRMRVRA